MRLALVAVTVLLQMAVVDLQPYLPCVAAALVRPVMLGPDEQLSILSLVRPSAAMQLQHPALVEAGSCARP